MKKFTMLQIFLSLPNHLSNQPRGLGILALFSSVFMFACGDAGTTENITNNYTSGMEIAEKVSDLPKCSADNAGEQYLVKADGEFYACNGKEWKALGGSGFAADYSCETKPLADDSGVAIYCGGDSIGVVQNGAKGERGEQGVAGADGKDGVDGKDGAQGLQGEKGEKGDTGEVGAAGTPGKDGKDGQNGTDGKDGADGVGCKVVSQTEDAVTIQCGDDKFSMNLNGGSGDVVPGEDVVSLAKLSGVSQKGPFINGSVVTLFELDGSRSLMQTGRTFGGEIITDDGRFSVNNVSLKSSYVRMTANGFYRNEVTGKNSTASIVLNAYSDLQARSSVNINLLTHLEYYRVGYLMENGLESTIKAAKKRAQKEIFAAFSIDNEGFGYSEDLDVFGEGDQNAALLAMSILLQGDRSEADLSALLASFGKDIEEDGTWDDIATRAKIADWALRKSLKDSLLVYRKNIESWGIGTDVPYFEKYIGLFVEKEFGFNPVICVDGKKADFNEGVETISQIASLLKDYLVCVESKWKISENVIFDKRDDEIYKVTKIGNQTWMAENLRYIPVGYSYDASWGCEDDVRMECFKNNGRYYIWAAAIDSLGTFGDMGQKCGYNKYCDPRKKARGICPEGWHIPNNDEWDTLFVAVDQIPGNLLSLDFPRWGNATDRYGFSARPEGFYFPGYAIDDVLSYANYWSLSSSGTTRAYGYELGNESFRKESVSKDYGYSVRCLKD